MKLFKGASKTIKLLKLPKLKLDWVINRILKILYFSFIVAGIVSAVVSALIEFETFAGLFIKSSFGKFNSLIPALIVFTFETSKVYLIYMNKSFKITSNEHYLSDKRHFLTLRYALISISVLATLIFSFYNLREPEYDKMLAEKSQNIAQIKEVQRQDINRIYDEKLNRQLQPIDQAIMEYEGRMTTEEGYKFKGRQEYRGPRYKEAQRLKESSLDRRLQVITVNENERIQALNKLEDEIKQKISNEENNLSTVSKSGNKMLLATLQTINLKNTFPEWQYLIIIAFISIMLSIGLEYIIWAAFTTLAIDHTKKLKNSHNTQEEN